MPVPDTISEPFPIFKLAHRYILYDIDTITYIRAQYHICGVLVGGLPQAPQQNVFLGVPLELMSEEARLLCEKGVAYVMDDVKAHKQGYLGAGLSEEERRAFQASLRKQGQAAAGQAGKRTEERKMAALSKKAGAGDWNDIPEDMLKPSSRAGRKKGHKATNGESEARGDAMATNGSERVGEEDLLFASPLNSFPSKPPLSRSTSIASTTGPEPYAITPTTSYPPLTAPRPPSIHSSELPEVPVSYPLFKHLHSKDYFLAPGLRFGCQYMAYPGDPLRFHSHFLCNGMDWDQEFDLLDLVGGGRLGTGVKKGFLIGGEQKKVQEPDGKATATDERSDGVRAFCIEWGGM